MRNRIMPVASMPRCGGSIINLLWNWDGEHTVEVDGLKEGFDESSDICELCNKSGNMSPRTLFTPHLSWYLRGMGRFPQRMNLVF